MLRWIILFFAVSAVTANHLQNFKVVSLLEEPYLMKVEDEYQGIIVDVLNHLARNLNFTYDIVLSPDGKYGGEHSPGQWNGLIGELINGTAEVAAAPLTLTSKRAKVVYVSHPFYTPSLKMLYKPPDPWANGEPLTVLFTPFTPGLWVMIIFVFVIIALFFYGVGRFDPYEDCTFVGKASTYEGLTMFNSFLYTFSSLTWQGYTSAPRSLAGRVMAAFWWIFTMMFIATYVANLTAFFLTQEPSMRSVPFASFEELSRQSKAAYGTTKGGSTAYFLQNSKKPVAKRLWTRMNRSESNFVSDLDEAVKRVRTSNYAFIGEGPLIDYLASREPCDLMSLGGGLGERNYGFACSKKQKTLCSELDQGILMLHEQEILFDIHEKWLKTGCLKNDLKEAFLNGLPVFDVFGRSSDVAYEKAVTLRRFSGAFLVALIGFIFATIALFGEIFYARRYGIATPPRRMNVMSDDQEQIQDSFHD